MNINGKWTKTFSFLWNIKLSLSINAIPMYSLSSNLTVYCNLLESWLIAPQLYISIALIVGSFVTQTLIQLQLKTFGFWIVFDLLIDNKVKWTLEFLFIFVERIIFIIRIMNSTKKWWELVIYCSLRTILYEPKVFLQLSVRYKALKLMRLVHPK